ncbi:3-hydroxyacyl-CoA dehydrogenase NAD-binding domain-containing protein [Fontisubflavum oceani]|uniref:3-hydroxyacyl-CoA dehydrogenase NAD-binding domain-containing protein n=1 Tax=Fontisubflavum oceani TaxID=2978973 RepID=UPI0025B5BD26|nr:3-hydroxyacyl-CoA dehydrogenase NAD-binding domain-containing protein [Fontisubflavum oceani]WJY21131.1 3-hydroxyacyl-CoA dehydrogenase NAD-binding domain-containing protein [Fontisubflavum oceani]
MQNRVLILGAGAIGTAMAAVFRSAGRSVEIADPAEAARKAAPEAVMRHLGAMARAGFRQTGAMGPLQLTSDLAGACPAGLVIEAGPENREIKAALFQQLLSQMPDETVLTTTSSAIPISEILPTPVDQARCLVAHPGNPPSLIRVLELVPGPGTTQAATDAAVALFSGAGFDPVVLGQEIPGFVFNRLQSALLREAYRLVDEGVIDVDGVDRLVRDGLGPRWALSGPFETADLNTAGGISGHAKRMGPAYAAIGAARGETHPDWSPALVEKVTAERRALLSEDGLPDRRAWRETALADLLAARRPLIEAGET